MLTEKRRNLYCLLAIIATMMIVVYKVFASTQLIYPNADVINPSNAAGRWTTWNGAQTAGQGYSRLTDGAYGTGIKETTVSDTCVVDFATFTLPVGATNISVDANANWCVIAGAGSVGLTISLCSATNCEAGTEVTGAGVDEISECSTVSVTRNFTTAPDGTSWDQADIDGIRMRFKMTSVTSSSTGAVSEAWLQVNYTIPSTGARRSRILKAGN